MHHIYRDEIFMCLVKRPMHILQLRIVNVWTSSSLTCPKIPVAVVRSEASIQGQKGFQGVASHDPAGTFYIENFHLRRVPLVLLALTVSSRGDDGLSLSLSRARKRKMKKQTRWIFFIKIIIVKQH